MKKTYTLLFVLLAALTMQAQTSIGLSFAMPTWRPLNSIIDRYNDTRPWLDKEMGNVHFMPGYNISFGLAPKDSKFAFQFIALRKSSGRFTSKGNDDKRDLSVRLWTVSIFDFTYYPLRLGRFNAGFGLMPIELSRLKIRGRVNDDKFETYWKSNALAGLFLTNASSTPHIDVRYRLSDERSTYLQLRLYWMLSWWGDEHMVFVNDKINSYAASANHYSTQNQGCSHIGLQVLLSLF